MKFALREVGRVLNTPVDSDAIVLGWSVDSRTINPGDLFFALRGPAHDGADYIPAALERGAIAIVTTTPSPTTAPSDTATPSDASVRSAPTVPPVPSAPSAPSKTGLLACFLSSGTGLPACVLAVPNPQAALEQLATWARNEWSGDVIGVTGSAGKTSTKDVIATMLASQFPTGKTTGNFNNHVGLPLSILRLPGEARVAVLEIGMNHAGEIRHLCGIAKPRIGVVTNVGYAHIEMFDSIEGIALAKRELIECLPPDGIAVLNNDDPHVRKFAEIHPGPVLRFGLSEGADVRAQDVEPRDGGTQFRVCGTTFRTALQGRHAVLNILAGLAVAQIYGIAPAKLVDVVATLQPSKMRGERLIHNGITILNDCYNSNPDAVHAMLDVLKDTPAQRRIAVLGEMLELGRWSVTLHRDIGRYAVETGVNVLVGIRGAARSTVDAAKESGLPANAAYFFEDPAEAGGELRHLAHPGDAILFKGSRGTRVDRALERFLE